MNGYEKLNSREADLLWDGWKEKREMPEADLDDLFDRLNQSLEPPRADREPCDLYGKCGECPNFQDCFSLPIPQQVSSKVNL